MTSNGKSCFLINLLKLLVVGKQVATIKPKESGKGVFCPLAGKNP
jgi:hypothetical protein